MKSTQTLNFVKLAACLVLVVGISAAASASCGDSMSAMAAAAAAIHNQSGTARPSSPSSTGSAVSTDNGVFSSIVGMWHIRFMVGDQTIQEAYQIWNTGGTEVHNPNVDPRTGNVCLGVWTSVSPFSYNLVHRVWWYDANGTFMGTIHLSETLTLGNRGTTHSGAFTLDFYDPDNNFLFEVAGNVAGERISVE